MSCLRKGKKVIYNKMKLNKIILIVSASFLCASHAKSSDSNSQNFETFVANVKSIKVNEGTSDDVINLMGKPVWQGGFAGNTIYTLKSPPQSTLRVWFDPAGHVLGVQLDKEGGAEGRKMIYLKGVPIGGTIPAAPAVSNNGEHFPLKDSAPVNPTEGQYYFNTTDKHAYIYNGTEWLQLDKTKTTL